MLTRGFGARLRTRAAEKGLKQADLHRLTGLSRQSLSDYFAGRKVVGTDGVFALADALDVDPRWLVHGGGQAQKGSRMETTNFDAALQLGLQMIPEVDITYSLGGGSVVEDHVDSRLVPFRADWLQRLTRGGAADVFLTRGQGDSMMPTILDDDDVLVNRADAAIRQQDRIWALGYGELGMIKRVRRLPSGLFQLNSDNPAVTPVEATEDEIYVVGRVIWIGRRV